MVSAYYYIADWCKGSIPVSLAGDLDSSSGSAIGGYKKMAWEKEPYSELQQETGAYYDMLYDFSCLVSRANEQSFEGLEPKKIAKLMQKSSDAFLKLCMVDSVVPKQKKEVTEPKEKPKAETLKEALTEEPKERPLPDNFLKITPDGWGLCPVCGNKVLKVTATTRLENFPVFCKRCRADHIVNWWNADEQRILYKRYVSDRYIRDRAYKGTGLKSFQNTGSSAPERVIIGI